LEAREDLAGSGQRYRNLVEQVPAVSYIADWSPEATFVYVSPQIEAMLGFPPSAG
jgi:PAS domain-containing protein